ncbi:MAG: CPBP family intramembrane metalloprotease [Lachnospiraceae bacterium]|nr:CPBP family intramembrane metalloprotease [Lachnospiraceae bacterium]
MSPLKSGILYLLVIVSILAGSVVLAAYSYIWVGRPVDIVFSLIYSEVLMLLPTLLFAMFARVDINDAFGIHSVKRRTILFTIPYVLMIMPMVSAMNALSMLFTHNVITKMENDVVAKPFLESFFVLAIFGPFVEELVFRGVIFSGLRKSRRILAAIILQAFMFGFMHMNFNQFGYAVVVGIAFGLLREVTGSILPSFTGHMLINGWSTILMYVMPASQSSDEAEMTKYELLSSCVHLLIISFLALVAARYFLRKIAKSEECGELRLYRIFHNKRKRIVDSEGNEKLEKRKWIVTVPAVLAMIISAVVSYKTL